MTQTSYNKLVRDKIPDIINEQGGMAVVRKLSINEYKRALLDKLIEEAHELRDSGGLLEERADVGEVLAALDVVFGWRKDEVLKARQDKCEARGGFAERLFLEYTLDGDE